MSKAKRSYLSEQRQLETTRRLQQIDQSGYAPTPEQKEFIRQELGDSRWSREKAENIIRALEASSRNIPKLTDAELDVLADKVAEKLRQFEPQNASPHARARWRAILAALAYDIAIGLLSSGLYAALVYAVSQVLALGGPDEKETRTRESAYKKLRGHLVLGEKYWNWSKSAGYYEDNRWYEDFEILGAADSMVDLVNRRLIESEMQRLKDSDLFQEWFTETEKPMPTQDWASQLILTDIVHELTQLTKVELAQKYGVDLSR